MSKTSQQNKYLNIAPVQSKFNFTPREKAIYEIYKIFSKYYCKHFDVKHFLPKNRDPRKSRNWKNFEFVQSIIEKYDTIVLDKFILSQILWCKVKSKSMVCNPSFLSSDKAIDRYAWFLKVGENYDVNEDTDYSSMYIEILKQNAIFLYKEKKKGGFSSFKEMFLKRNGLFPNIYSWVLFSKVDNLFLSISSAYNEIYETLEPDVKDSLPKPDDLSYIRRKIILNKELKDFCITIFKNECVIN